LQEGDFVSAEIKRTLLETTTIADLPGWEMRLFLIEYPAGADGSGHWHPVRGINYVVSGSIVTAFGDDEPKTYSFGQTFQDEANRVHTIARNASDIEPLTFLAAYTVRVGEPNTVQGAL
jgi:quercetin dioxygenase-like cupin family protein